MTSINRRDLLTGLAGAVALVSVPITGWKDVESRVLGQIVWVDPKLQRYDGDILVRSGWDELQSYLWARVTIPARGALGDWHDLIRKNWTKRELPTEVDLCRFEEWCLVYARSQHQKAVMRALA